MTPLFPAWAFEWNLVSFTNGRRPDYFQDSYLQEECHSYSYLLVFQMMLTTQHDTFAFLSDA